MGDGSGTSGDGSTNYPPVGSPDRYDMIVQRGRALRRRRRYTLGAGAGGTVVALAVAVVLITNGGPDDANATEFADDATTTTTTVADVTTTSMPSVMTVTIASDNSTVLVQDPAQPLDDAAKQCVYLRLTTPDDGFVAEGSGCNTSPEALEIPLSLAEIGQACTLERYEPSQLATEDTGANSSSFVYRLDPTIPAGEYVLTAQAVSGLTDGCADTNDPAYERETRDTDQITIELP